MDKFMSISKGLFSYSGNKYRIWNKHLKSIFSSFSKVHEPFCGSAVCVYNAQKGGQALDIDKHVIALHNQLQDVDLIPKLQEIHEQFFGGRERNAEDYYRLRASFNETWPTNPDYLKLHLLIQMAFNSLLRFGPRGFNVPFGQKEVNIERFRQHQEIYNQKEIKFRVGDFQDLDLNQIDAEKDVIYLDPPYLASKFQYDGWNKEDESRLLKWLDLLHAEGFKWVLSNTFLHKEHVNEELIQWSHKFHTLPISKTYNAWTGAVKSVQYTTDTKEVIIRNFEL